MVMLTSDYERLPKAPIVEAVIDIRVSHDRQDAISRLQVIASDLAPQFDDPTPIRVFEGRIHFGDEEEVQVEPGRSDTIGYMLRNEEAGRVAQLKLNNLVASKLKPYQSWDDLETSARELWASYRDGLEPKSVTRIGTRYINRLKLPSRFDTGEYFSFPIDLGPSIPETLTAFHQQYVLALDGGASANIRFATESSPEPESFSSVILDIDCYKSAEFDPSGEEFWRALGELRDVKNRIFFSYLTDRLIEEYR